MKPNDSSKYQPAIKSAKIAAIYGFAAVATSPFVALSMLTGSKMINENQPFLGALTDLKNIKAVLNPEIWGRVAIRRLFIAPATGESARIAAENFGKLPDYQRAIIYSCFIAFTGSAETLITIKNESEQILLSRDGVFPKPEQLKKSVSAAIPTAAIRNMTPITSLFMAKEMILQIQEKNGGEPLDKTTSAAIGIACGAIMGLVSLPSNVATNMAIKTGNRPTLKDVFSAGFFNGWQARAMHQGLHVGSLLVVGLAIDALNNHDKDAQQELSSNFFEKPNSTFKLKTLSEKVNNVVTARKLSVVEEEQKEKSSNPFLY